MRNTNGTFSAKDWTGYIGKHYNRLTILKIVPSKSPQTMVEVACDCGIIFITNIYSIVNGTKQICGRSCPNYTNKQLKDLTGQRFGRLIVQNYTKSRRWLCLCDCGKTKEVYRNSLVKGLSQSCGCLQKERAPKGKKSLCL